jgi:hypothetical protein
VPELAAACAERAAGATHHGAIAFRCLGIDDRRRFAIGAAYFVRHWFPLLLRCNNPFGDDWFRAAPLVICSEVRAAFARLPSLLGPRRNIPRRSELATVWIGSAPLALHRSAHWPQPAYPSGLGPPRKGQPMRTTTIPLLRQLPCGFTIERCGICGELAFADEICCGGHEAIVCPSRAEFDMRRSVLTPTHETTMRCLIPVPSASTRA